MIIDKFSHVCFHIFKFLLLGQYVLMKFTTSDSDKKNLILKMRLINTLLFSKILPIPLKLFSQ